MIGLLRKRRSIRVFEDRPVDPGDVAVITEALLRSPSSRGIDPWEFIVVDDRELLKNLSRAKMHGSSFLAGAPLGIVICADTTKSDVWIEDCSIASIIAQLTAHSLGLGSCWVQIRNRMHDRETTSENFIRSLLSIPDHVAVLSIIAIGHPAERRRGKSARFLDRSKLRHNRYDTPLDR